MVESSKDKSGIQAFDAQRALVTRCVKIYLCAILVLTFTACSVVLFRNLIQHRPYPYDSLLFYSWDRFADLTRFKDKVPEFLQTGFFDAGKGPQWIYPPASLFLFISFYRTPHPLLALTTATVLIALLGALAVLLFCRRKGYADRLVTFVVVATLITSYPFVFLIDRANMEAFILLFASFGVIAFLSGRFQASAICFAIATCVKPFPVALFFLLLRRRRFSEIAVSALLALVVNLVALHRMGPNIIQNAHGLVGGLRGFNQHSFSMLPIHAGFDHSLFTAVKQFMRFVTGTSVDAMEPLIQAARQPYAVATVALGLVCVIRIWNLPFINQIFALTIVTILFPYVSYDYTLTQLYLPWALFFLFLVTECHKGLTAGSVLAVLLPCAIVFTPQSFLIVGEGGIGATIKSIALLFLLVVVCIKPFPSALAGEVVEQAA